MPADISRVAPASADGFSVDRKQVVLRGAIKELGLYEVTVVLHPEVDATIEINVARSPEEAELQASGKSIQDLAAEEEAAEEAPSPPTWSS